MVKLEKRKSFSIQWLKMKIVDKQTKTQRRREEKKHSTESTEIPRGEKIDNMLCFKFALYIMQWDGLNERQHTN